MVRLIFNALKKPVIVCIDHEHLRRMFTLEGKCHCLPLAILKGFFFSIIVLKLGKTVI